MTDTMPSVQQRADRFTLREQALIRRGYPAETVAALAGCGDAVIAALADEMVRQLRETCPPVERPECIFLGGQPGAGKSTWARRFRAETDVCYAELNLDACRSFHPAYRSIEDTIRRHWAGGVPDDENSPGNDMADFTHSFAGKLSDAAICGAVQSRMNVILEWGLRNPEEPLRLMEKLDGLGYCVTVLYIAADGNTSMEACRQRSAIMNSGEHIMRRVPVSFHAAALMAMPESCRRIYEEAVLHAHWCDEFRIMTRSGETLWMPGSPGRPETCYREYLMQEDTNPFNDPEEALKSMETELRGLRYSIGERKTDGSPL